MLHPISAGNGGMSAMPDETSLKLNSLESTRPTRPIAEVPTNRPNESADPSQEKNSGQPKALGLTWLLVLLATLALEIASTDGDRPAWTIAITLVMQILTVAILHIVVRKLDSKVDLFGKSSAIPILLLASIPFIIELFVRGATDSMLPLELLLLAWFRNGVLSLAVFAHRRVFQQMCCSLSTFLMIFASALSTQIWLHGLVVAFTVIGIWWLMGSYWDSIRGRLAARSERDLSRRWMLLLPMAVLFLLVSLPVTVTQTHALSGFMPSSGGTDWYSESARSGVGDGDALVAGTENIQSFSSLEDAPFLTSHEPSLYDLFDDSYNEPVKTQKQERAIALPRELAANQKEHHLADSKTAAKEFSTVRKFGGLKRKRIDNRNSNALFYVKGRTPLHLKLEVFDQFDGRDWFPELADANPAPLKIETLHNRPWLRLPNSSSLEIYSSPESHALKIVRLNTNRVPSPTQLLGIHVDKVDREDFYAWAQPGIVRMDREKLPSQTVFHLQSRVVDERLVKATFVPYAAGTSTYRQHGDDERSETVKKLAQEWTQGTSYGWPQIHAIVERLRREKSLDKNSRPPEDCDHTVHDFLFNRQSGPDYQFASSAVMMLRSLGYSARLVSGFYVHPARYENRSRHTPVLEEDVHFWAEVFAGQNNWIPIEPSPDYELLKPQATFHEQMYAMGLAVAEFLWRNIAAFVVATTLLFLLIQQRHFVADQIATAAWRMMASRQDRVFIQQSFNLFERRCHRAGYSRSRGMTATRWLEQLAQRGDASERRILLEFIRLSEWASFAPQSVPAPASMTREVCVQAISIWTWKRIATTKANAAMKPRSGEQRRNTTAILAPRTVLLGRAAE